MKLLTMIIGHDWTRMSNIKTSSTEYDSVCMCELIRDLLDRFWSYCNRSAWESACWLNYGVVSYWLAMKLLTMIGVYLGMSNIKTSTGCDGAVRETESEREHGHRERDKKNTSSDGCTRDGRLHTLIHHTDASCIIDIAMWHRLCH